MISESEMRENHFRSIMIDRREGLDRDGHFVLAQERGYTESRARDVDCGSGWACAVAISARQSCVMATDQESNNLDEFDLEQVINWEEHNYASKNLEIQQLPDLDLPTDLPVSGPSALPGTSTTVSHGRQLLLGNQVIGSHPQQTREQNASLMAGMPQVPSTSSVLNPVFPQSASCMITDIRDELAHSRVPASSRHMEPAFPSENFDLPSINHQSPLVSSGSQPLSYMAGHRNQVGSMQVPTAQQLGHAGHAMPRHRPIHNGMQSFNQPNLTSSMPNLPVNEPLNPSMENDDGGDSIDQLIEDIVDRDMPQGVGDAVVFSSTSHGVPLSNQHQHQHQPMHHVMTQNPRSSSPSQMAAMVRSPSSGANGSPLAGGASQIPSGKPLGSSMPHANSPLSQNPASPIKAPSPQMPQYKASIPLRPSRGGSKSIKLPGTQQQQPHSPQNMAIGVNQGQGQVHSPRPTPQRSPQQPGNAQSPPSAASSIMSQNISSPLAQMSPLGSGTPQNIMGNLGVQQSPVASPMNISSPQSQRPSRQASPGLCNIGSPVPPAAAAQEFPKHQTGASLTQTYMNQANTAKPSLPKQNSLQNGNNMRQASITQPNVVRTQASALHQQVSSMSTQDTSRGNIWTQNPFLSSQQLQRPGNNVTIPAQTSINSSQIQSEQLSQEQTNMDIPLTSTISQQGSNSVSSGSVSLTQPTSTFDTATVLRGLNALKGTNVIPVSLKQGTNNQQLQAVKLPNTAANIDLLKQAMLLKGGQGGVGQTPGKPMSINTSQGQVFYYILPKGTNIGSGSGSAAQNTSGQQVKMVLINTKTSSANTSVKTVNSTVDGAAKPSAQVFSLNNNSMPNSTATNAVATQPVVSSVSSSFIPSPQGQNPIQGTSLMARSQGATTAMTSNPPSVISTSSHQQHSTLDANLVNQLVSGQGASNITIPSNSPSAQNISTTQITFVNECTAVSHLVSATGVSQTASNIFTTHPFTLPVSTTVSKATAMCSTAQPSAATGDSDDSDTPLAVVAESLRKAGGDEKKKKKKKKGEKRKKKDKSASGSEKVSPAFQIFFKDTQAAIRQQNPSAQFNDVTKIVRQMWENLPEDQKKVYYAKYERAKADKSESKPQEPSPKIRKLENAPSSTASPISSPKTTGHPSSSSVTLSTTKEPIKQESITLKIPKSVLNKSEPPVKVAKVTSTTVSKTMTAGSTTSSPPVKIKKPKMSINPISQRICIRDGCNMPARTTKERGTQYCSNDCIIAHCRHVFNSWVSQRKQEVPVS